ncbi:hypothetical protein LAZ67_4002014 [Cordylochernes scorpioides]|uniref:Transposase n=1 Tax=Cordylochernes scorpioides TaxID=51811 RepID=A0ABY6KCN6_9ARAC|nr:hypothetical protein LAZ67_4002014 [Cordylochernes scorpioides]
MLKQTFKEDSLSQSRTFEWFVRYKAGPTSVKDDPHTGRPLSIRNPENALKIKSSIKDNPRITIRELSEDLDISFGTYQTIIKNDLHLKRSPAKFVPHLLTNEQKEHRKETCKNMVEMFNSDPHWLKNVIAGDKTWVYGLNPETKRQSSQWLEPGEPRFKKARMIKSKLKCLLIIFFDVKGLVHYEFVPEAAFKLRRISTEDEHGPGRPVESVTQENIDKIHDLVMLDRRMTVRQIEETLGIPKTTVDRIMREHLGLRKISARWVPKLLTPDQKAVRRKLSSDNLALFEANPVEFVNIFVTMDETWAHHFTPESKQQSM